MTDQDSAKSPHNIKEIFRIDSYFFFAGKVNCHLYSQPVFGKPMIIMFHIIVESFIYIHGINFSYFLYVPDYFNVFFNLN